MMKKEFLAVPLIGLLSVLFTSLKSQAQTNSATTNISIILTDVIAIDHESIALSQPVIFNYATVNDYNTSQTHRASESIRIISTKPYDLKVKANGESFTDGVNHIPISVLSIKPVQGGATTMEGTMNTIRLTTFDQNLVSNAPKGFKKTLDIDYHISELKASSSDILGKPAGNYSQTITYTAVAL